jgi:hypothetical protein
MVTQSDNYDIDAAIDQAVAEDAADATSAAANDDAGNDNDDTSPQDTDTGTATTEKSVSAAPSTAVDGTPPPIPSEVPRVPSPPATPGQSQRVRDLENQNAEYVRHQRQQKLEEEVSQIRQDLENQGYMPEQAQQISNNMKEQAEREAKLIQTAHQREEFVQGQYAASISYARQYNLSWEDLDTLRSFNTPQEMEREAKRISETRGMQTKIAQYEQGRVPSQQFDTGQSSPAAGRSRERILDDYINGRLQLTAEQYNRLTNGR